MFVAIMTDSAIALCIRWVLAVIFSVAVVHKLSSPAAFVATMKAYRLLPAGMLTVVAYSLIAAELATVIALLLNSVVGSVAAFVLLTAYTLAIFANLLRGRRDIDCGCTGAYMRQTLSGWLLVRNSGFIVLALMTSMDVDSSRSLEVLDIFSALAAAITFALIYYAANHIASVNGRFGARQ